MYVQREPNYGLLVLAELTKFKQEGALRGNFAIYFKPVQARNFKTFPHTLSIITMYFKKCLCVRKRERERERDGERDRERECVKI